MPIHRLVQDSSFSPEDVKGMGDAFEQALEELGLVNRSDPLVETVAQYIVEAAQTGEKDAGRICALAIARIEGRKRSD